MYRIDYRLKGWREEETRTLMEVDHYDYQATDVLSGYGKGYNSVCLYLYKSWGLWEVIEDITEITYLSIKALDGANASGDAAQAATGACISTHE